MALSGSGGAYYRAGSLISTSSGLHVANTIHCWLRASSAPSTSNVECFGSIVGNGQNPHEQLLWNHTSATFYKSRAHRSGGGAYSRAQLASTPATNTWLPFTSPCDGTTVSAYLSGALDGSAVSGGQSSFSDVWVSILALMTYAGALDGASQFDIGEVAEFAVWNVALSADEARSLARGFRPPLVRPQSLVFYAPLRRGLQDIRDSRTLVKQAGTEVFSDHPPVFG